MLLVMTEWKINEEICILNCFNLDKIENLYAVYKGRNKKDKMNIYKSLLYKKYKKKQKHIFQ